MVFISAMQDVAITLMTCPPRWYPASIFVFQRIQEGDVFDASAYGMVLLGLILVPHALVLPLDLPGLAAGRGPDGALSGSRSSRLKKTTNPAVRATLKEPPLSPNIGPEPARDIQFSGHRESFQELRSRGHSEARFEDGELVVARGLQVLRWRLRDLVGRSPWPWSW